MDGDNRGLARALILIVRVDEAAQSRDVFLGQVSGGDGRKMRFARKHDDLDIASFTRGASALGVRTVELAVEDDDRNVQRREVEFRAGGPWRGRSRGSRTR